MYSICPTLIIFAILTFYYLWKAFSRFIIYICIKFHNISLQYLLLQYFIIYCRQIEN